MYSCGFCWTRSNVTCFQPFQGWLLFSSATSVIVWSLIIVVIAITPRNCLAWPGVSARDLTFLELIRTRWWSRYPALALGTWTSRVAVAEGHLLTHREPAGCCDVRCVHVVRGGWWEGCALRQQPRCLWNSILMDGVSAAKTSANTSSQNQAWWWCLILKARGDYWSHLLWKQTTGDDRNTWRQNFICFSSNILPSVRECVRVSERWMCIYFFVRSVHDSHGPDNVLSSRLKEKKDCHNSVLSNKLLCRIKAQLWHVIQNTSDMLAVIFFFFLVFFFTSLGFLSSSFPQSLLL